MSCRMNLRITPTMASKMAQSLTTVNSPTFILPPGPRHGVSENATVAVGLDGTVYVGQAERKAKLHLYDPQ
jgi:hypothetical protein